MHNASFVPPNLQLNNSDIMYDKFAVHLGHMIGADSCGKNMSRVMRDIIIRTNIIMTNYWSVDHKSKCSLYNSYCTSYYGCLFFDLSCRGLNDFVVCWRKSIRRLLNFSPRTRSALLPLIINKPHPRMQLFKRLLSFWTGCLRSNNSVILTCTKLSIYGHSVIDNNLREAMFFLNIDPDHFNHFCFSHPVILCKRLFHLNDMQTNPEQKAVAEVIVELVEMRANLDSDFLEREFDKESILLNELCTS